MNAETPIHTIRLLQQTDFLALLNYYDGLSPASKNRFAPHVFDPNTLAKMFVDQPEVFIAYIGLHEPDNKIIAYTVLRQGIPSHDAARYLSYGLQPDEHSDCLLAPSVADNCQGMGLGTLMLKKILDDLRHTNILRIFLWGGVQATNTRAINFYQKHQFSTLGRFEHYGQNIDMMLVVDQY
jgi:ribosomal protein S18 acetylase RimI-like enzyme